MSAGGRLYNLDGTFVNVTSTNETIRVQGERIQAQIGNDGNLSLTTTAKTSNRERRRSEARSVHQATIERHNGALAKLVEAIEILSKEIETGVSNADVAGPQLTKLIVQKGKLVRRSAELEATASLSVAYQEVESGTTVVLQPGLVTATFLGLPLIWCPRYAARENQEEIPTSGPIPTINEAKSETPTVVIPVVKSKPPPSPMIFPAEAKSPFFAALSTSTISLDSSTAPVASSAPVLNGGFATFDFTAPPTTRQFSTSSEAPKAEDEEEGVADESECNEKFVPVVTLTETKVDSGEGDEDCVFQQMSMLYRFDAGEQSWKTRGKGYIKLLKHRVTQQVRLVLREDKTLKVRMNHKVNPLVELKPNGDKAWLWATTDYSEEPEGSEQTFSAKFSTAELAKEFKAKHDEARIANQAGSKNLPVRSSLASPAKVEAPIVSPVVASKAVTPTTPAAVTPATPAAATPAAGNEGKSLETCLYEEKCVMYRYDSVLKTWPKPKSGQVKLLQHKNGQVRIIVQEPSTSNPCLNHLVNPSVELKPNAGSDKSWTWAAVDYADSPEGSQNTFAIKFRDAEQSATFKKKHDEAKTENARGNFETGVPLGDKEEPTIAGTFGSLSFGASTSAASPFGSLSFGGTSGLGPITSAIFGNTATTATASTTPFNFGSFSSATTTTTSAFTFTGFTTSTTTTGFSFPTSTFSFATPASTTASTTTTPAQDSSDPSDEYFAGSGEGGEDPSVEAECAATFVPVVQLTEKTVDSGEGDEDVVYQQMCLLYRFDNEEKAWKTRGKGYAKLLQHRVTNKFRIVLREDKTLKVRMNHFVSPTVELKPNNEKSWMWTTTDYAEEEPSTQTFSIKFTTAELANEFKAKHDEARLQNSGTVPAKPFVPSANTPAKTPAPSQVPTPAFSTQPKEDVPVKNAFEALKNATDWVCKVCEVDNKQGTAKCRSCENPNPDAPAQPAAALSTGSGFTFGAPLDTPFTFGTSSNLFSSGTSGFSFASTAPFTFGSSTTTFGQKEEGEQGEHADDEGDEGEVFDEGDFAEGDPAEEDAE